MKVTRLRNRKTSVRVRIVALAIAAGTLGLGCELIVDFDRTKIQPEGSDGAPGTTDGSIDSPNDTSTADTSPGVDAADAADTSVTDSGGDAPDGD